MESDDLKSPSGGAQPRPACGAPAARRQVAAGEDGVCLPHFTHTPRRPWGLPHWQPCFEVLPCVFHSELWHLMVCGEGLAFFLCNFA